MVLVFGGSLGATTLNRAATAAWAADDPGFTVVHITGEREFGLSAPRAAPHYRVLPYTASLGPLLAAADLVVSRAGGSVFEIAAAGRPAILVPSPNVTADHQSQNAAHIADGGAAIVIADSDLTAVRLSAEVDALLAAPDRLAGMAEAARRLARPDASERIATELLALAPVTLADRRLHMLGIGGAGMSALAVVAYAWGADVSGCDRAESDYSQRLRRFGIEVAEGHDRAHLEPGMEVVVSSAVPDELDELAAASELGLRVMGRGELLAELVALRRSICVAGAHGKTTTTAMIAYAAQRIGLEPTWLVGGEVPQLGGNAGPGSGDLLVAEADESDGSCALLRPRVAVVTNVDLDHHARFGSLAEVEQLFADWVAQVPADGAVVLGDGVSLPAGAAPVVRFGFDPGADWHITGFRARPEGSRFWLSVPGEAPLDVGLRVPGAHNARNAAGALAALAAAGASPADAADALADFTGVGRRFELRGDGRGRDHRRRLRPQPGQGRRGHRRRAHARARPGGGLLPAAPVLAHRRLGARLRRGAGGRRRGGGDRDLRRPGAAGRRCHGQAGGGRGVRAAARHAARVHADLDDAAGYLRGRLREGDLVLTVGAGDVRRVGDALLR